jgi:hypothetical protein
MTAPRHYTTDPNMIPQDQTMAPQDRTMAPQDQTMAPHDRTVRSTEDQFTTPEQRADPYAQQSVVPEGSAAQAPPQRGGPNESDRGDSLFAEREMADLRNQWNDVQAGFVDDPRECVQRADGLVSTAVEQLTASFAHARSRLEDQWSRGEEASTEELRVALKRYRDFFDRLLAV